MIYQQRGRGELDALTVDDRREAIPSLTFNASADGSTLSVSEIRALIFALKRWLVSL